MILLALYWRKLTNIGAFAGMVVGAIVAFVWGQSALFRNLYEMVPGFLNLIVSVVVSLITYKPNPEIEEEFDQTIDY